MTSRGRIVWANDTGQLPDALTAATVGLPESSRVIYSILNRRPKYLRSPWEARRMLFQPMPPPVKADAKRQPFQQVYVPESSQCRSGQDSEEIYEIEGRTTTGQKTKTCLCRPSGTQGVSTRYQGNRDGLSTMHQATSNVRDRHVGRGCLQQRAWQGGRLADCFHSCDKD